MIWTSPTTRARHSCLLSEIINLSIYSRSNITSTVTILIDCISSFICIFHLSIDKCPKVSCLLSILFITSSFIFLLPFSIRIIYLSTIVFSKYIRECLLSSSSSRNKMHISQFCIKKFKIIIKKSYIFCECSFYNWRYGSICIRLLCKIKSNQTLSIMRR